MALEVVTVLLYLSENFKVWHIKPSTGWLVMTQLFESLASPHLFIFPPPSSPALLLKSDKFVTLFISAGRSPAVPAVWLAGLSLTRSSLLSFCSVPHFFVSPLVSDFLTLFPNFLFLIPPFLPKLFLISYFLFLSLPLFLTAPARLFTALRNNLPHAALPRMIEA